MGNWRNLTRNWYPRNIAYLLLFLFPSFANLITHSSSTILLILSIMGMVVLLNAKHRPDPSPPELWVMGAFAAYFMVHVLAIAVNRIFEGSPKLDMGLIDHELRWLAILPIYALFRQVENSPKILWAGLLSGAALSGIYATVLIIASPGNGRINAASHSIAFGDLALTFAFMGVASMGWMQTKKRGYFLIPAAAFFLGLGASIFSGSRGGWVALPALIMILFFYFGAFWKVGARLTLVACICFFAVAAYMYPPTKVKKRVDTAVSLTLAYVHGSQKRSSVSVRISGWRAALEIFKNNPIIGIGSSRYKPALESLVASGKPYKTAIAHHQPHSTYLITMVECGSLGLLALLAIFISPFWVAIHLIRQGPRTRDLGYALLLLVTSFAHYGLTETIFGQNVFISTYLVITAAIMALGHNAQQGSRGGTTASV